MLNVVVSFKLSHQRTIVHKNSQELYEIYIRYKHLKDKYSLLKKKECTKTLYYIYKPFFTSREN